MCEKPSAVIAPSVWNSLSRDINVVWLSRVIKYGRWAWTLAAVQRREVDTRPGSVI